MSIPARKRNVVLKAKRPQKHAYLVPSIIARAGNVVIEADGHGMGFTCTIDGQRVERLRAVTLSLELDQANLVHVEFLTK